MLWWVFFGDTLFGSAFCFGLFFGKAPGHANARFGNSCIAAASGRNERGTRAKIHRTVIPLREILRRMRTEMLNSNESKTLQANSLQSRFLRPGFLRLGLLAFAVCVGLAASPQVAAAQTETVLYSFCSQPGCADNDSRRDAGDGQRGETFMGAVAGGNSKFYAGVVFEVSSKDEQESLVYDFCRDPVGCGSERSPGARRERKSLWHDGRRRDTTLANARSFMAAGCCTNFRVTPSRCCIRSSAGWTDRSRMGG